MKKIKILLSVLSSLVFVQCEKPSTACFSMSTSSAYVNQPVTFTSCSTCKNCSGHNTVSDLQWDFGDGVKASGGSVTHSYSSPGQYHVTLTSNDKDGDAKGTVTQTITITKLSDLTRTGKFIAFTSNQDGDYDVYLAQVDANGNFATSNLILSQNPYNLTNANTLTDKQANWSADGRILVYSAKLSGGEENIYAFFFNADGTLVSTSPTLVQSQTAAWDENPGFSPDSRYIIFDRRVDTNTDGIIDGADSRDIMLASVNTTTTSIAVNTITKLTNTSNIDEDNAKWSTLISVQRIAYESPSSSTASDHDIYVMDPLNPSNNINYNNPGSSGYPAWVNGCTRIIFESNSGNGGFYKIVSAAYPNNTGTTDVVKSPGKDYRYPANIPNGNKIAFIELSLGIGNIYIVNADGSGTPVKLLPTAFDAADNSFPAW
jgi:Tol biopolymer transport system component